MLARYIPALTWLRAYQYDDFKAIFRPDSQLQSCSCRRGWRMLAARATAGHGVVRLHSAADNICAVWYVAPISGRAGSDGVAAGVCWGFETRRAGIKRLSLSDAAFDVYDWRTATAARRAAHGFCRQFLVPCRD